MNHKYVAERLISWLQTQVQVSNSKGLLVGISGGVDSAVVANLIKLACPNSSLGVIIPIHSSNSSLDDAILLIHQCNIQSITVDLSEEHQLILNKSMNAIKKLNLFKDDYLKITDANLRARLRMSTLYSIANNLGYMVVGTDNADETYTGYFTKFGDGAVGKVLGVPETILKKAPSADLWENQTDESEMGVSYESIEKYISGEQVSEKDEKIILSLHKKSEHKRNLPPYFEF